MQTTEPGHGYDSATYFETLLCATTGEKVQNRTLAKVRSEFRSAQCETLLA